MWFAAYSAAQTYACAVHVRVPLSLCVSISVSVSVCVSVVVTFGVPVLLWFCCSV